MLLLPSPYRSPPSQPSCSCSWLEPAINLVAVSNTKKLSQRKKVAQAKKSRAREKKSRQRKKVAPEKKKSGQRKKVAPEEKKVAPEKKSRAREKKVAPKVKKCSQEWKKDTSPVWSCTHSCMALTGLRTIQISQEVWPYPGNTATPIIMYCSRKYHTTPMEGIFFVRPHPTPLEIPIKPCTFL